ncbi:MAG: fatty acid desaturase [Cytophagales bacterium]|nr:fatty acid desaturase [Cytophagales bacterium]
MLQKKADRKTVLYILATIGLFLFLWESVEFYWPLYIVYLFLSVAISVIIHNHIHNPIWKNRRMNQLTDHILTIFYGFPVFGWIPTHVKNHHVHGNRSHDYTKTYWISEKNNLLTLVSYPSISGYHQNSAIGRFLMEVYRKNRKKFYVYLAQIITLVVWVGVAFYLDWQKALIYVIIPQQVSLFFVLVFNYVQHVHADEESEFNHSRNIMGSLNFFLFNNGLHTIHHLYPGLHWSKVPPKHQEIDHLIHDQLKEPNLIWYFIRVYLLGIFFRSARTRNFRRERLEGKPQINA